MTIFRRRSGRIVRLPKPQQANFLGLTPLTCEKNCYLSPSSYLYSMNECNDPALNQRSRKFARPVPMAILLFALAWLDGCGTCPRSHVSQQIGESVVLIGEEPAFLSHAPLADYPVRARSTYLPEAGTVQYVAGTDFILNGADGTLRRTRDSRVPDFRTNILFGKESFDHSQFPGYGNAGHFVFVDYAFADTNDWPSQLSQLEYLKVTRQKLMDSQPVRIVAFGDSITAGGNASQPALIFWERWADDLRKKYPAARITAVNGATGGDTTVQGLQRLRAKVLMEKPDLVLIGFGMNDNNINSVPVPAFQQNLLEMVARIRAQTRAEIILFSAFPHNPRWKFGSPRMAEYATATARAAREAGCAYADVFDNWQALALRKKPEDLLANNINHPNDFGHWIYYRVFQQLGL
jgi:acyl-CoA thioesterase I